MSQENFIAMDPFPQEGKESNKLYKFYDYLKKDRLTTTRCKECGRIFWPPRTLCPKCSSDEFEWEDMPTTGRIYAYTVLEGGVPMGFKPPLVYALIDFDNGIRLFMPLLDTKPEDVEPGLEAEFMVQKVSGNRVLPAFRLKKN